METMWRPCTLRICKSVVLSDAQILILRSVWTVPIHSTPAKARKKGLDLMEPKLIESIAWCEEKQQVSCIYIGVAFWPDGVPVYIQMYRLPARARRQDRRGRCIARSRHARGPRRFRWEGRTREDWADFLRRGLSRGGLRLYCPHGAKHRLLPSRLSAAAVHTRRCPSRARRRR